MKSINIKNNRKNRQLRIIKEHLIKNQRKIIHINPKEVRATQNKFKITTLNKLTIVSINIKTLLM